MYNGFRLNGYEPSRTVSKEMNHHYLYNSQEMNGYASENEEVNEEGEEIGEWETESTAFTDYGWNANGEGNTRGAHFQPVNSSNTLPQSGAVHSQYSIQGYNPPEMYSEDINESDYEKSEKYEMDEDYESRKTWSMNNLNRKYDETKPYDPPVKDSNTTPGKSKLYRCRKCGAPKKGHTCNANSKNSRTRVNQPSSLPQLPLLEPSPKLLLNDVYNHALVRTGFSENSPTFFPPPQSFSITNSELSEDETNDIVPCTFIGFKEMPSTPKILLSSGALEGHSVKYVEKSGRVLCNGIVHNGNVLCLCKDCRGRNTVNISEFEKHAGSIARYPSIFIRMRNGKSLKQIITELASARTLAEASMMVPQCLQYDEDEEDETTMCWNCGEYGIVFMCSGCDSIYHPSCVGLEEIPKGEWYCDSCSSKMITLPKNDDDDEHHHPYDDGDGGDPDDGDGGDHDDDDGDEDGDDGEDGHGDDSLPSHTTLLPSPASFVEEEGKKNVDNVNFALNNSIHNSYNHNNDNTNNNINNHGDYYNYESHKNDENVNSPCNVLIESNKKSRKTETPNSVKMAEKSKIYKRDPALHHKALFLPGGLPDGIELAYYTRGQPILGGRKQGAGILCDCCDSVLSCSQFEHHAGMGARRNPYNCICLSDGRSLHDVALEMMAEKGKKENKQQNEQTHPHFNSDLNDDNCYGCRDGGILVLCDNCPAAYHPECVGLAGIPSGDWFCPACASKDGQRRRRTSLNEKEKEMNMNSNANMHRNSGGWKRQNDVEEVSERTTVLSLCRRLLNDLENVGGGCVLCRSGSHDFSKNGFGPRTIMLCDQCEREFHVGCLKEHGLADLACLPENEWFCCKDCEEIHQNLNQFLSLGPHALPACVASDPRFADVDESQDYTWQILKGRRGDTGNGRTLLDVINLYTESFNPIIDKSTGTDLIPVIVHSQNTKDHDFGGMYCIVLKYKNKLVSAASLRVFGKRIAEMPLVATSSEFRRKGYCRVLFNIIEFILSSLGVKSICLPSATETEKTWIHGFEFSRMKSQEFHQLRTEFSILVFPGTAPLHRPISSHFPNLETTVQENREMKYSPFNSSSSPQLQSQPSIQTNFHIQSQSQSHPQSLSPLQSLSQSPVQLQSLSYSSVQLQSQTQSSSMSLSQSQSLLQSLLQSLPQSKSQSQSLAHSTPHVQSQSQFKYVSKTEVSSLSLSLSPLDPSHSTSHPMLTYSRKTKSFQSREEELEEDKEFLLSKGMESVESKMEVDTVANAVAILKGLSRDRRDDSIGNGNAKKKKLNSLMKEGYEKEDAYYYNGEGGERKEKRYGEDGETIHGHVQLRGHNGHVNGGEVCMNFSVRKEKEEEDSEEESLEEELKQNGMEREDVSSPDMGGMFEKESENEESDMDFLQRKKEKRKKSFEKEEEENQHSRSSGLLNDDSKSITLPTLIKPSNEYMTLKRRKLS